jgi:cytochrome c oxidase subunit 3
MGPAKPLLPVQWETKAQHNESNILGMWLFIAQEIMFFGGLFTAYAVYRMKYPDAWAAGAEHLNVPLGALNTVVLLVSSLTMAMSVYFTQTDRYRALLASFAATLILGATFLVVKYFEYTAKWETGYVPALNWHPEHLPHDIPNQHAIQLYYVLYFTMTGMHALHMVIGIVLGGIFWVMAAKRKYGPNRHMPIEIFGFYWHFVDIVWVFLFPMIYLIPHPS